jgi:hypothetical protein
MPAEIRGLTHGERRVLDLLETAWNQYTLLPGPPAHPKDDQIFSQGLDDATNVILARVATGERRGS